MEIRMPQLGESVTEGTIGRWLVRPGDRVHRFQPIAEVITDKVNAEIPSPVDGEVLRLEVPEGTTVPVGTVILTLSQEAKAEEKPSGQRRVRYSPVVMRLAQEHGIDLSQVEGTGLGGRITRKDVEALVARRTREETSRTPEGSGSGQVAIGEAQVSEGIQPLPVGPIRRRIAEKMVVAKREVPHAWTMMPVDVTGLVQLRAAKGDEFRRREGVRLSYVAFFIQAVAEALREFPILNSQWAGDRILVSQEIHISVAVATEEALAVPVIRHADRLSLVGLSHALADVTARARAGRLTVEDVTGGTFTVNNTGAFGSFLSAPIINHPQAAILSFEAITKTPVVVQGDAIAVRSIMNMCLSLDHRVLDGLVAGRFLQAVKATLERRGMDSDLSL